MEIRRAIPEDYEKIIALQKENTPDKLSEEDKQRRGFIVSSMNTQQVAAINQALGILVAMDGEKLAGFLCMAPSDAPLPRHPVVDAMLQTFPEQQFGGKTLQQQRVFVYGPVCVGAAWQGQGVARKLFVAVKEYTRPNYEVGAAFVNDSNPHSLKVHVEGFKMTALTPFSHEQNTYQLVVFSTAE